MLYLGDVHSIVEITTQSGKVHKNITRAYIYDSKLCFNVGGDGSNEIEISNIANVVLEE